MFVLGLMLMWVYVDFCCVLGLDVGVVVFVF